MPKEVRSIRDEIKKLQAYNEEKLYHEADVIAGTPIGLFTTRICESLNSVRWLLMKPANAFEPLAWCIFPLADKYVLAGDHFQLPPTCFKLRGCEVGYERSILEVCIAAVEQSYLLNTQYRMRQVIAGFSSGYFMVAPLSPPSF